MRKLALFVALLTACSARVTGTSGSTGTIGGTTSGGGSTAASTTGSTGGATSGSTGSSSTGSTGSSGGTGSPFSFDPGPLDGVAMPRVGDHGMRFLSPTVLELWRVVGKQPDPARVDAWDFVDESSASLNGSFPGPGAFAVEIDGQPATVAQTGFRRRTRYAPLAHRDLRILSSIYLVLAQPAADGAQATVGDTTGSLWPSAWTFSATLDPLRPSSTIHVSQLGYPASLGKHAFVGGYLGNLGELPVAATTFRILDARTGAQVFQGALALRQDQGFSFNPAQYQAVLDADFTALQQRGLYRLQVDGLGASMPFFIDDSVAGGYARTYALGLYHQRCGMALGPPFTRFAHGADHTAPVRTIGASDSANWTFVTNADGDYAQYQASGVPRIVDLGSMLYPFVNSGWFDVSGGHHDAGDYSKYTTNSAALVSTLVFSADNLPGVGALDNLGIPESGDGISDILQEAKWEADFLAKLQDGDGAFYFLVYPRDREYEGTVTPDHGDGQLVWPKNTAASAAATAALAEAGSSPRMKAAYPQDAARYLAAAQRGWTFLQQAIADHGSDGAYQKLTHYGNEFRDQDELTWAAAALYAATGDTQYRDALYARMPDPQSPDLRRWGWVRLFDAYGGALRSCAFATRSGRLPAGSLDATYEQKCQAEVIAAGTDQVTRANASAYATSFPLETKAIDTAGWYFSSDPAFDLAAAWALQPDPDFLDAIVSNLAYETGGNPVNVSFLTGIGWKRQREIVHQWAENDARVLPPSGIPLGNLQAGFAYGGPYNGELGTLNFPNDGVQTAPYAFYDRWGDAFNVTTEFVNPQQARALGASALLMALSPAKDQPWRSADGHITGVPLAMKLGQSATASFSADGLDLTDAQIVWDAPNVEPAYGASFELTPVEYGPQTLEAEAFWPDGRRAVAAAPVTTSQDAVAGLPNVTFTATQPNAAEAGPVNGEITISRDGDLSQPLDVHFAITGGAAYNLDYNAILGNYVDPRINVVTLGAGQASVALAIQVFDDDFVEGPEDVVFTATPDPAYVIAQGVATVTIADDESP